MAQRGSHALHETEATRQTVDAAVASFRERYGNVQFPPIAVVIPAYNEEGAIGGVLRELPDSFGGLDARVIVVDDGSKDATFTEASQNGAMVARLEQNCGQGTAFRTGYRIAREAGAKYIATLDADGQWNPADLPPMIELLEADKADFVLGSRRLGATQNTDAVRNIGVRLFSLIIRIITGTNVTDTSSGLRAFRAEITAQVTQTQPQYQSSELLIGAAFQGYRIAEVPTVMRVRTVGVSKKGGNGFYGLRYAQVILKTALREWKTRKR